MNATAAQESRDILEHLAFRGPLPGELGFIFDSWLRSQWHAEAKRRLDPEVFYPAQRKRIGKCLERSSVLIAMSPAAPDEALGYAVHESMLGGTILHWLYVKKPFRRLGIARCLLDLAQRTGPASLSHSHKGDARSKRLLRRSTFNPYLGG